MVVVNYLRYIVQECVPIADYIWIQEKINITSLTYLEIRDLVITISYCNCVEHLVYYFLYITLSINSGQTFWPLSINYLISDYSTDIIWILPRPLFTLCAWLLFYFSSFALYCLLFVIFIYNFFIL